MAAPIPTVTPQFFTAGDTVKWNRNDLAAYPSSTWTLTYYFYNSAITYTVVATADGTGFLITISAATSATYTASDYKWEARVSNGSEEYTVDKGYWTINTDIAVLGSVGEDFRSQTKIIFDAIEAVIQGRASKDQQGYTIAGRRLDRTPIPDLIVLRDKYKREYLSELSKEKLELGKASGRKILVTFK